MMRAMNSAAAPMRQLSDLPGPKAWPVVGNALQLERTRIHLQMEQWVREYGPVFRISLGKRQLMVLSDHEAIAAAMRDRPEGFRRPSSLARILNELGMAKGLFVAEGEEWHRQRRMVMTAFSPTHVRAYFPQLKRVSERLMRRWNKAADAGAEIDLQADLMRFTVDVITGLAFGVETNTLETEGDIIQHEMDKIFPMLFKRLNAIFPLWHYYKREEDRALEHALQVVQQAVDEFMAKARARLAASEALRAQPANLIEAMIVAADEPGSGMTDADVAGNVFTMLLAGEDTTANTMAWTIYLLHRNPQTLRKAQAEARAAMPSLEAFDMDQVAHLPYLEACLNEGMRLKPVAPFRMLEALKSQVVAGVALEAGTMIWCANRFDAMSEHCFPDAKAFEPQRWLDDAAHGSEQAQASVKRVSTPFGAGPRVCPGRYLAMVEMKLCMAMWLRHFDLASLDTPDGQEAQEVMSFTMTPVGLRMALNRA
jgi:cytochrome P450